MSIKNITPEESALAARIEALSDALAAAAAFVEAHTGDGVLRRPPAWAILPSGDLDAFEISQRARIALGELGLDRLPILTQPADQPGDFYVMLDYEKSADHATTIHEAREKARRIFESEPLPTFVSIADTDGNTLEDLGRSPGTVRGNIALRRAIDAKAIAARVPPKR